MSHVASLTRFSSSLWSSRTQKHLKPLGFFSLSKTELRLRSLTLSLCASSPPCFALSFCLFLSFFSLTLNFSMFLSMSSPDSCTILPSCQGIRAFLVISKLAKCFPASSSNTTISSSSSSSSSHFGPDLPPQQLSQPEMHSLYHAHTNAGTLFPILQRQLRKIPASCDEHGKLVVNQKTVTFVFLRIIKKVFNS